MATLASLMCAKVRTCSVLDAENMHLFMLYLGVTNEKAIELLELNGRGCIYSSQGDTAKDWELLGYNTPELRGKCVKVTLGGKVELFSKREFARKTREKRERFRKEDHEAQYTPEAARKRAEEVYQYIQVRKAEREYKRTRELEALFEEGQTKPSPKRQGTGKSLADMGKYVSRPAARLNIDNTQKMKKIFGW